MRKTEIEETNMTDINKIAMLLANIYKAFVFS